MNKKILIKLLVKGLDILNGDFEDCEEYVINNELSLWVQKYEDYEGAFVLSEIAHTETGNILTTFSYDKSDDLDNLANVLIKEVERER